MIDDHHEFDRLAGQPIEGVLSQPELLPEVLASLAAWLRPANGYVGGEPVGGIRSPFSCPAGKNGGPGCLSISGLPGDNPCVVCSLLDGDQPNWPRIIDLFVQCRALRGFADHAANWANTSHVAAILLTRNGLVLDCDCRGESFLKAANVLRVQNGQLHCVDPCFQPNLNAALKDTSGTGRASNILLHAPEQADKRYSLTLTRMQQRSAPSDAKAFPTVQDILCLVAPLDGRRIATARQLMDFFGLSAAEARLARALCHGDSVEEYARDQGLRLPTVRTQLSSIFSKTGMERQATLVRLILGIPVVRDSS